MRFDYLKDKKIVLIDRRIIVHSAFEACVALANERRIDQRHLPQ